MSASDPAWCADCGKPLARMHGTAYVRCCSSDYVVRAIPGWPSRMFNGVRYSVMCAPDSRNASP